MLLIQMFTAFVESRLRRKLPQRLDAMCVFLFFKIRGYNPLLYFSLLIKNNLKNSIISSKHLVLIVSAKCFCK